MVVVAQPVNRLRNWSWVVSYQWGWGGAAAASAHWLSALSVSVWVLIKNCNQSQAFILSNPLTGGGNLKSWEHFEHIRQTPLAITRPGYLAAIIWRVMNAARWQSASRLRWVETPNTRKLFFHISLDLPLGTSSDQKSFNANVNPTVPRSNVWVKCEAMGLKLGIIRLNRNQDIGNSWTHWTRYSQHVTSLHLHTVHSFLFKKWKQSD